MSAGFCHSQHGTQGESQNGLGHFRDEKHRLPDGSSFHSLKAPKNKINNRPLRHSSPLFGRLSLNYSKRKIKLGYNISYNGKKKLEDFSPSELNKLYLYTQYGSPAWVTHNLFFKFNYNYFINFDFGIDNIFDKHYRTYSSGISAPGRNIKIGLNLKF